MQVRVRSGPVGAARGRLLAAQLAAPRQCAPLPAAAAQRQPLLAPAPRQQQQQPHRSQAPRVRSQRRRHATRATDDQQQAVPDAAAADSAAADSAEAPEEADFDLLSTRISQLVEELDGELKGCSIYLIGMMGSGKTTVGRMLANTLKYSFFDTDELVAKVHDGRTVADLWAEYGEGYFRQCEQQVLKELAPYKSLVVATGGGAVTTPMNWSYMHNGVVAWLAGGPDLLARRVVKEGPSSRPLLFSAGVQEAEVLTHTQGKLSALLDERRKYYVNADIVVPLEGTGVDAEGGAPAPVVMYRLLKALSARIAATKAEREAQRNFRVQTAGGQVVGSINSDGLGGEHQQQQQQQQQQRAEE